MDPINDISELVKKVRDEKVASMVELDKTLALIKDRDGNIIIPGDRGEVINAMIAAYKKMDMLKTDGISDTFHTFGELYHHRAILFATICNTEQFNGLAWKSKQHDDPAQPMYEGMFIVGIETPDGQATYHYDIDPYWDYFQVKELERAPKYDGHTPDEAIKRIMSLWRL